MPAADLIKTVTAVLEKSEGLPKSQQAVLVLTAVYVEIASPTAKMMAGGDAMSDLVAPFSDIGSEATRKWRQTEMGAAWRAMLKLSKLGEGAHADQTKT